MEAEEHSATYGQPQHRHRNVQDLLWTCLEPQNLQSSFCSFICDAEASRSTDDAVRRRALNRNYSYSVI